jgi:hypothetical protein
VNFVLYCDTPYEKRLEMNQDDMEWILNALRGAQEAQQELAATHDFALEQLEEITTLREKLVELCGRDLTDG